MISSLITSVAATDIAAASAALYLLPALIARARHVPALTTVVTLNVLAGWTLIGWAIALVIALRPARHRAAPPAQNPRQAAAASAAPAQRGMGWATRAPSGAGGPGAAADPAGQVRGHVPRPAGRHGHDQRELPGAPSQAAGARPWPGAGLAQRHQARGRGQLWRGQAGTCSGPPRCTPRLRSPSRSRWGWSITPVAAARPHPGLVPAARRGHGPARRDRVARLMACGVWLAWLVFAACLAAEVTAVLKGCPAPRLPGLAPAQALASALAGGLTLTAATLPALSPPSPRCPQARLFRGRTPGPRPWRRGHAQHPATAGRACDRSRPHRQARPGTAVGRRGGSTGWWRGIPCGTSPSDTSATRNAGVRSSP